MLYISVSFCL